MTYTIFGHRIIFVFLTVLILWEVIDLQEGYAQVSSKEDLTRQKLSGQAIRSKGPKQRGEKPWRATIQDRKAPKKTSRRRDFQETGKRLTDLDDRAYYAFEQGNYPKALNLAKAASKKGNAAAHTLIARMYAEGRGVEQNSREALKWYQKGAELLDPNAQFALGILSIQETGRPKDYEKAAQYFEKAALTGHIQANYNLGLLFLKGKGRPENPYRAAQHIRYSAEKGLVNAQYELGVMYQEGQGLPHDAYRAARWIKKAASRGLTEAQFRYAMILLKGFGFKQDNEKIIFYMKAAAEQGHLTAQHKLAHMYDKGVTVARDDEKMAKWGYVAMHNGIKDEVLDKKISSLSEVIRLRAWRDAGRFLSR